MQNCLKEQLSGCSICCLLLLSVVVVVVLGFYNPPTAKVIRRRDLGLKSHPKDLRSPGSLATKG